MLGRSTRNKTKKSNGQNNTTVPEMAADVEQNKDLLEVKAETILNDEGNNEGEGDVSVDNANLKSELNVDKILENNANEEEGVVVEEKSLDTVFSALEDIMNLDSEGGVEAKINEDDANLEESDIQVKVEEDAAAVGAVEENNSAANTKDMISQVHADDTLTIIEGGDGEGDGVKSREDVEDDEDSNSEEDNENSAAKTNYMKSQGHADDTLTIREGGDGERDGVKSREDVEDDEVSEYSEEDNENSAANTKDMKPQGHTDDTLTIREGGDGVGDSVKSREDIEDDEVSEYSEEDKYSEEDNENSAANAKDMKSQGHTDDTLTIREGGDGEGDRVKSREDVEDDEDNEYSEEDNEYSEEDNEEDEDPSEFSNDPLSDQKKQKQLEIYVGGLDKGAVEEDLIQVFGKFGEVQAARIVKHPTTNKSKGFGFIRYATIEQAKNALSKLKDGIEVKGKCVKISLSQDNDTLYMGNICTTWTKQQVLDKLKGYGVKNIEELHLPHDPESDRKIKGFAFLEFSNHPDAMTAFQRLRKPDAVFGRARSAKVAFAQTPMHPSAEVLSQVKTVYIKGITKSWDVEKLKVLCKQYGEIKKVKLSRNFGAKRKDFAFIVFTSRESALACVEGINNAQIVEGEVKVKAEIAKSHARGQLQKVSRGGFKVKKESGRATGLKMKGHAKPKAAANESEGKRKAGRDKSKVTEKKGKAVAEEKSQAPSKSRSPKEGKPKRTQSIVTEGQDIGVPSQVEKTDHKRKNSPSKADGRGKRARDHDRNKRPSKKPRGVRGRRGSASRSKHHFREGPVHGADSAAYRIPYASGYAPYTSRYQGHANSGISGSKRPYPSSYQGHANSGISGSKRHRVDMEPHAGYLEPALRKQDRHYAGYLEPALKHQSQAYPGYLEPTLGNRGQPHAKYPEPSQSQSKPHTRYLEPAPGNQGQPLARYLEPSPSQSQPQTRYLEPTIRREGLPHAGYLDPAVVRLGYNVYNYRLGSGAGGQGSQVSTYGGASALPPYVQNYTNFAGYEDNGNVGGYHHRSEAYLPQQRRY